MPLFLIKNWFTSPRGLAFSAAVFMSLFFLALGSRVHRDFYYLFLLLPFLLFFAREATRELFKTYTFQFAALFFTYFIMSLFWSQGLNAEAGFEIVRKSLLTACFVLIIAWIYRKGFLNYLFIGMTIGAVLSTWLALYFFYLVEGHVLAERVVGLGKSGHPINSSVLYGVALIACLTYKQNPLGKIVAALVVISTLTFIILAQSRGVILSLLAVYIVMLILTRRLKQLLVFSIIFGGIFTYAYRGGSFGRLLTIDTPRYDIWLYALSKAKESIFFGYGIYPQQVITLPNLGTFVHPHNVFISHLLYGGVIGVLILLLLVGLLLKFSWQAWIQEKDGMLLALTLYFIGIASFDYSTLIHSADVEWLFFWWVVGLIVGCEARARASTVT